MTLVSVYVILELALEVIRVTIEEHRKQLRWSRTKLAREAGIDYQAVLRAERGLPIQYKTLAAIAAALSRGKGKEVRPDEIEKVRIFGVES